MIAIAVAFFNVPRLYEQNNYKDSSRPSSTASLRSRAYGPHPRWLAEAVDPGANPPGAAEATSEARAGLGAAAAASSCKGVAVAGTEGLGGAYCEGQHQVQAASYRTRDRTTANCREKKRVWESRLRKEKP